MRKRIMEEIEDLKDRYRPVPMFSILAILTVAVLGLMVLSLKFMPMDPTFGMSMGTGATVIEKEDMMHFDELPIPAACANMYNEARDRCIVDSAKAECKKLTRLVKAREDCYYDLILAYGETNSFCQDIIDYKDEDKCVGLIRDTCDLLRVPKKTDCMRLIERYNS